MPLRADRTSRRLATLLVGSGGGQLIALCMAPVLTRLYDPAAFGTFGLFTAVATIAASAATLGLETVMVVERDARQARIAFGVGLVLSCASAVAVGLAGVALRDGGVLPDLAWPWLLTPSVGALAAGQVLAGRALALERPEAVAAGRLLRGAGVGVGQAALALSGATGLSLILGGLAGQVAAVAATGWMLRRSPGPALGDAGTRRVLFTRHRRLLAWSAPQNLLNAVGNSAVPVIIAGYGGKEAVGAFTLANRVVQLPAVTIGEALRQSLLASMSAIGADDAALRAMTVRWFAAIVAPLGLLAAIGLVAGPPVFAFAFGAAWRGAGLDAGLLLAAQASGIANIPALTAATVRGWQRGLFVFNATTLPVRLWACANAGGVAAGLEAWCALSVLSSLAVTAGTLARLRPARAGLREAGI
jgi:O-antigen/teichoic acid export membrane protein